MISFFVPGIPRPGGSKTAFPNPNKKSPRKFVIVDANAKRVKEWKKVVAAVARDAYSGLLIEGPVCVTIVFSMPRPKKHYYTGKRAGVLRETAPKYHSSSSDGDKLCRPIWDALKGIIYHDDGQIAKWRGLKLYDSSTGALVQITLLTP